MAVIKKKKKEETKQNKKMKASPHLLARIL
jgi:hypothetical protein